MIPERSPFTVEPTRVWRTYTGGKQLDEAYGASDPADGQFPESWIASTVEAQNGGASGLANEGLSYVRRADGNRLLRDLIAEEPASLLGESHYRHYGTNPGLLVKLIDSAERLTIQVHPTRPDAKQFFNSAYGKSEFWIVLGSRTVDGQDPYLLFGFKPGVTEKQWRDLFEAQDIPGMIDCLHKVAVKAGDTFAIPGGLPHAIGPGCFLLEAQEPTDLTLRPERITPKGRELSDFQCHQGAGFEAMLSMFDYTSYTFEELKNRFSRRCPLEQTGSLQAAITGPDDGMPFVVDYHAADREGSIPAAASYATLTCVGGEGYVGATPVSGFGSLFLPPHAAGIPIRASSKEPFRLIECRPAPAE